MSELSDKVLNVTKEYLGPAAEIFLNRQTKKHMQGLDFRNLEREHLLEFTKWVGLSAGLLIGKEKAKELCKKISQLI